MDKNINRIKVVLEEKKRTNKWLAEQMDCAPTTVPKWRSNVLLASNGDKCQDNKVA